MHHSTFNIHRIVVYSRRLSIWKGVFCNYAQGTAECNRMFCNYAQGTAECNRMFCNYAQGTAECNRMFCNYAQGTAECNRMFCNYARGTAECNRMFCHPVSNRCYTVIDLRFVYTCLFLTPSKACQQWYRHCNSFLCFLLQVGKCFSYRCQHVVSSINIFILISR